MTTTTTRSILREMANLDACGSPVTERLAPLAGEGPLPGLSVKALIATVQGIEPPRQIQPLVWGEADGRTILFRVDDATILDIEAALADGEEPTAIVEPCQIVSIDI